MGTQGMMEWESETFPHEPPGSMGTNMENVERDIPQGGDTGIDKPHPESLRQSLTDIEVLSIEFQRIANLQSEMANTKVHNLPHLIT